MKDGEERALEMVCLFCDDCSDSSELAGALSPKLYSDSVIFNYGVVIANDK